MQRLLATLQRLDGRGYGAYRELRGPYRLGDWTLFVDHVQPDPFAPPSRLRLRLPLAAAAFAPSWLATPIRRVALADFLTRAFEAARRQRLQQGRSLCAALHIDTPGQEVLPRTSVALTADFVEARLQVQLPARGRTILGQAAATLLGEELPAVAEASLRARALSAEAVQRHLDTVEDQEVLRQRLPALGLVAFVGDGALLPRRAGNDDRPLATPPLVYWQSPPSLAVEVELPHAGRVRGTGIPQGVTLIVGGGYHGKSTLLQALMRGIYNHIPGDGRERVVSDARAVAIRAEDGRRVEKVTLTPFIRQLPFGRSTARFSSDDASGSTSQAANIIEALEVGARVLLIDEDTSATNFMVRDRRMQELVAREQEPITPFIDRVRQLSAQLGVSTVLVMGGVGDYLEVADTVLHLLEFSPHDVTARARAIAAAWPSEARRRAEAASPWPPLQRRPVLRDSLSPQRGRREQARGRGLRAIQYGEEEIDVSQVEQLVHPSQTRYIADCLRYAYHHLADDRLTVGELVQRLEALVQAHGLEALQAQPLGDRAWARPFEVAAALNRLRCLRVGEP